MSFPKLTKDSRCMVIFHPQFCIIQDYATMRILGVGRAHGGMYFVKDQPLNGVDNKMKIIIECLLETGKDKLKVAGAVDCPKAHGSYIRGLDMLP